MKALVILLLWAVVGGGGTTTTAWQPPLVLKRQIFYTDPLHRISVSLNVANSAASQMHTLLVFSAHTHHNHSLAYYHDALVVSPAKLVRYSKVTLGGGANSHRQMAILSKGVSFLMEYDVAPYSEYGVLTSGKPQYDALLLLDRHSSVWNQFDTMLFEESRVTLSLHRHGHDPEPNRGDYAGLFRLHCAKHWKTQCKVNISGWLLNGHRLRHMHQAQLVLNLDSPHNLLPHALFMMWQFEGVRDFTFTVYAEPEDTVVLRLNPQFQYRLNEHGDDVVLGVDVVRHFQRVEYSPHRGSVVLWYSRLYADNATYETHKSLVFWLISLILTCISCWFSSPTYDVLRAILKRRPTVEYPYQLIIVDLVTMILAPVLWILVFTAGDEWQNAFSGYHHCVVLRRQVLIFAFGLYHLLLQLLIIGWTGRALVRQCARHYYHHFRSYFTARGVDKEMVGRESDPVSLKLALFSNLAGHTLQVTNFMLIVNYVSEEMTLYTIPLAVASLCLLFYYVKTLMSSAVFIARNGGPREEPLFTALWALSAAVFVVYCVLTTYTHYTSFFMMLNSVFSELDVTTFAVEVQCFIAALALIVVFLPLTRYVRKHQRKALERAKQQ